MVSLSYNLYCIIGKPKYQLNTRMSKDHMNMKKVANNIDECNNNISTILLYCCVYGRNINNYCRMVAIVRGSVTIAKYCQLLITNLDMFDKQ